VFARNRCWQQLAGRGGGTCSSSRGFHTVTGAQGLAPYAGSTAEVEHRLSFGMSVNTCHVNSLAAMHCSQL
jgi:hypothetical protein